MKFWLTKKKKKTAEKYFKIFKTHFYFYAIVTKTNWAIRFFSFSGGLLIEFVARNLFTVRRERRAKDSFDFLMYFFFRKFAWKFREWKNVATGCFLRLFGSRLLNIHYIRSIIYYWSRTKIPLKGIQDCTPYVFNGCRIRKKKR
jgi:hypothetical protein